MRRNLLLLLIIPFISGCGSHENKQAFTKARIVAMRAVTNEVLQDETLNDNFTASAPDATGLVEIKGEKTAEDLKVDYYQSEAPDMLNVKFAGKLNEWRKSKGHDIMVVGTPASDTLTFIFGNRGAEEVKGTITFTK